jgi:hypothetical protein
MLVFECNQNLEIEQFVILNGPKKEHNLNNLVWPFMVDSGWESPGEELANGRGWFDFYLIHINSRMDISPDYLGLCVCVYLYSL